MIALEVLFINRTNESAQDVTLELFASPSLRVPHTANKVVNLEPYGFARDKYILYVDNCEAGVIYGNITAKFTQEKQKTSQGHTKSFTALRRLISIFDHSLPPIL